ncbi:putative alpha/beta hydrolase, partial [Mycobacterium kansasii]
VAQSLGAQSLQLPKIGADLETIAASLTEAQRSASGQIATLEGQLQQLDNEIGQAAELEKDIHLTNADRAALDALISALEDQAIADTKSALGQL